MPDLMAESCPDRSGLLAALRLPLVLWGVVVAVALATRPPVPIDETRYLSVAWEMWHTGGFLVPHLNGMPYSDKPPLLFWLIHAGWAAFGVAEWWARLVPALAALAGLALTVALARELWPDRHDLSRRAASILVGLVLWAVIGTLLLFDPLLAACALLAQLALVRAARGARGAWWLVGLGIGLGVLAKGPVILLHVLPVALAGPWWAPAVAAGHRAPAPRPGRWYAALLGATALGSAIALAWALPAAAAGGPVYAHAILLGQTAGRMANAFEHRRAWWWYLPLLPVIFYPYALWPPLWRAARRARGLLGEGGVRFVAAATVPSFVLFSLVSGKQPQYLLPLLPPAALLAARLLGAEAGAAAPVRARDLALPMVLPVLAAVGLVAVPFAAGRRGVPPGFGEISAGSGLALLLATAWVAVVLVRRGADAHRLLAVSTAVLVAGLHLALAPAMAAGYDLRPLARYVRSAEQRGRPIAQVGEVRGELHFLGRIEHPFAELDASGVAGWIAAHPAGAVIVRYAGSAEPDLRRAEYALPFRGKQVAVWGREGLAATPGALAGARPSSLPSR